MVGVVDGADLTLEHCGADGVNHGTALEEGFHPGTADGDVGPVAGIINDDEARSPVGEGIVAGAVADEAPAEGGVGAGRMVGFATEGGPEDANMDELAGKVMGVGSQGFIGIVVAGISFVLDEDDVGVAGRIVADIGAGRKIGRSHGVGRG